MRRLLALLTALVLVAFLAGNASAGDSGDSGKGEGHDRNLTLFALETASTTVSATGVVDPPEDDPNSFTPGARFISVDTLYSDEARTDQVGRNDIHCTITEVVAGAEEPTGATVLCGGVVRLDGEGSLAWDGTVTFDFTAPETSDAPVATVAVTGGTDAFEGAGGQIDVFDVSVEGSEEVLSRYEIELLKVKARG